MTVSLNLSMGFSLVASTGGAALMPLYARNLMPNSVVSRPIRGAPPMIDLVNVMAEPCRPSAGKATAIEKPSDDMFRTSPANEIEVNLLADARASRTVETAGRCVFVIPRSGNIGRYEHKVRGAAKTESLSRRSPSAWSISLVFALDRELSLMRAAASPRA